MNPKIFQFLVCCFAAIGSFTYGYDLSVIAQVEASESFTTRFNPSSNEKGAIVSLFTGGAFFGAFSAGLINDRIGRRLTILAACIFFMLGAALQCGSQNLGYLFAGRFIGGFGVGKLCMIIPLYQAEIAHPTIRGTVTSLQQFFLGIGALASSWIGYGCYLGFDTEAQFRVPLGLQIVPVLFLASFIMFFPESPRWLVQKGKLDRALKVIANLHAKGDIEDAFVRTEFEHILHEVEMDKAVAVPSWIDLLRTKDRARRIVICAGLQASAQMTGVSAIQYYSPTIFAQMGLSTGRTLLYQSINSIIALIAQGMCVLTIDKTGRRPVLIASNFGSSLMFLVATILMAKFPAATNKNRSAQIGFIGVTWIYNFIFSWGIGPLTWVIPSESFSLDIRSKGVAIATMVSFAFNTMIGQVTDKAMAQVGWRYYILFVICSFSNALFFWAFLPETANVPLESMDRLWGDAPYFIPGWKQKTSIYLAELEEEAREAELGEKANTEHLEQHSNNSVEA